MTHIFYIICVWKTHQQLIVMQNKVFYICQHRSFCSPLLSIIVHHRLFITQWVFLWNTLQKNCWLNLTFQGVQAIFPEIGKMSPDCFQSLVFAMFPCAEQLPSAGGACASVSACLLIRMRICVLHMRIVRSAFPLHTTEIFHHMKANRGWYACRASRFHLPCPLKLVGPRIQQHLVPIWSQAEGWVPHCAAENTAYCTFK